MALCQENCVKNKLLGAYLGEDKISKIKNIKNDSQAICNTLNENFNHVITSIVMQVYCKGLLNSKQSELQNCYTMWSLYTTEAWWFWTLGLIVKFTNVLKIKQLQCGNSSQRNFLITC